MSVVANKVTGSYIAELLTKGLNLNSIVSAKVNQAFKSALISSAFFL
jgi:hypothetical protein